MTVSEEGRFNTPGLVDGEGSTDDDDFERCDDTKVEHTHGGKGYDASFDFSSPSLRFKETSGSGECCERERLRVSFYGDEERFDGESRTGSVED